MHRAFTVFSLLLLLFPALVVADFSATFTPARADVFADEHVHYMLAVRNSDVQYDMLLQVKSLDLNWVLSSDYRNVVLPPQGTQSLALDFEPLSDLRPGDYGINLVLTSDAARRELFLPVRVLDPDRVFAVDFYTEADIDPATSTIAKVSLHNTADRSFSDVTVRVSSAHFLQEKTISIGPYQERVVEFPLTLSDRPQEGSYPVTVTLLLADEELASYADTYTVGRAGDVTEVVVDFDSFLRSGHSVTKKNEGNAPFTDIYALEFSLAEKLFTSFTPAPSSITKIDGHYRATWQVSLAPGESVTIETVTSYRLVVLVLLILVASTFAWYYFSRRSVVLVKRVMCVQPQRGKLSTLKVTLIIKNVSSQPIHALRVMDQVPNATSSPVALGAIVPFVKKGAHSVTLLWDLATLRAGEERTLGYELRSALHFSGTLTLPRAVVRYREGSAHVTATSNTYTISEK